MPGLDSTQAHESKLYYELSHLYDASFTRVFGPRVRRVIAKLGIEPNAKVLEVGVGTGLSAGAYPNHCQVTGIDLAPEMLEIAQEKLDERGLSHVRLLQMDALNMKFEDNSFDYTMAFHVVTVVPDHERLMREMIRVTRPGGRIVIVNHFRSRNRILSTLDRMTEPVTRLLGWHTLSLDEVLAGQPLRIEQRYKESPRSLFTILVATVAK